MSTIVDILVKQVKRTINYLENFLKNKSVVTQEYEIHVKYSDAIKFSKQISLELLGVSKVHKVLKEAKEGKIEIESM